VFGSEGVALLREGHFQPLELSAFLELSLPRFDDPILHLQGVVPHQRLRLLHQLLVLLVLLPDLLLPLLILLRLLALGTLDFPANVLSRVSGSALKLSLDPSAVVVGVLVLYEVSEVDETLGEVLVFSSLERVVSFLDVGHPLPRLQSLSLLVSLEECGVLVVLESAIFLIADLGEDGVGLGGEAVVDAHAVQQKIGMVLLPFVPPVDLVLLHRSLLNQYPHFARHLAFPICQALRLEHVFGQQPHIRSCLCLLCPIPLDLLLSLLLFHCRLFAIVSVDKELFLRPQRPVFAWEVAPVCDDMQSHSGLILELLFAHFNECEILVADEVGLLPTDLSPSRQLLLPEGPRIHDGQPLLLVRLVAAHQQQEHPELCLTATGTAHLQIGLFSLQDRARSSPVVEDVGKSGGSVLAGVVDHPHCDLLISEAYFVSEEGPAEQPFLHANVRHSLRLLRVSVPAEREAVALRVNINLRVQLTKFESLRRLSFLEECKVLAGFNIKCALPYARQLLRSRVDEIFLPVSGQPSHPPLYDDGCALKLQKDLHMLFILLAIAVPSPHFLDLRH